MLDLNLQNLAKLLGARYQGNSNIYPQRAIIDSRTAQPGDLFFALPGHRVDGHEFVENALQQGAVGAVINNLKAVANPESKNLIICEDPLRFLQDLAKLVRQNLSIPVIGITGSTGKTTTKDLVSHLLSQRYNTLNTQGNYNNELGMPLTLCGLNKSHEAVVLEMGMRGLGQIDFLCQLAKPTHGIITNIGEVHAELLGSQEKIAQAKAELLKNLPQEGTAFLNLQDRKLIEPWLKECKAEVQWYSLHGPSDIFASQIKIMGEAGSQFRVHYLDQTEVITLNIPGEHNISNALAAIGVARSLNLSWAEIKQGLAEVKLTDMRLQIVKGKGGAQIVNDTYNANPTSMEAALKVLAGMSGQRKIAVLGDMYELGRYQEEGHKRMGAVAYKEKIDIIVAVGDLGMLIGMGAMDAGMRQESVILAQTNDDALEYLQKNISKGDVVLVKGSRGMKMENIVQGLVG
ncbi:MAG: UDP-N-acetylmuramoyl-tripeptide--D-alanyl-D-alanine ligase [Bacillota bacterium]